VASRQHVAEPERCPSSGGEEQPIASASTINHSAQSSNAAAPHPQTEPAPGPAWMHSAAASAVALYRAGEGVTAAHESDAFVPNIPAENPDAVMVDGLEGLAQLTFAADGADFDPCVSRDGKWLVFASTQHRPTPDIYIKPVGSRTVTQLTADPASDVMPALSPDASRIAFCSNRGGWWNLYVMSTSGGQAVQLSTGSTHDLHPSWSPDGTHLVFSRLGQASGRWELWVMDVSRPQVAEFIGYGLFPQWCPMAQTGADKQDRILFQRGRERGDRAFSLWTIDYTPGSAGNPTEIVSTRAAAAISASWSPDGQWIVYSTVATGPNAKPGADLWITAVDGSGRVNLTGGKFSNLMPTWGSDGRIYFVSDRNGMDQVWSIGASKALAAAGANAMKHAAESAAAPTGE
jgi:TolB protein